MNDGFEIEFSWFDWEYGSALDRSTSAELRIGVNGQVVTKIEDLLARTVRSSIRVSAYPLAIWLAANWWRLRCEPEGKTLGWRMSHNIAAVGQGFVWPDLQFTSDGSWVIVQSIETSASGVEPIRYLARVNEVISTSSFERAIDRFIEGVLGRLESLGVADDGLRELWNDLRFERSDPEARGWRRLEALLGFDPDEAPEGLIRELQGVMKEIGVAAVEEMAAGSKSASPLHVQSLWQEGRAHSVSARIPAVDELRELAHRPDSEAVPPWQRAAEVAALARRLWDVPPGPVSNDALGELFGVQPSFVASPDEDAILPSPAGFRTNGSNGDIALVLTKRYETGRRFALGRIVADHVSGDAADRLLPVTDARTARQKFQRAFAQELLCPFEELKSLIGDDEPTEEVIDEAAYHFNVSPLLIRTTLVNRGMLGREELL